MDSPGYMKQSYMTRNPYTKHQGKEEKRPAYSPYNAMQICWWRYTAGFWTHFRFDYSLAQRAAMLQICLNYMASNVVNTQPRNSRIHACELHIFALFGTKNLQFFILACVLQFRTTKSVIAESWTAWQWVNNATELPTAAKLDLNWEANKTHLHDVTHGNNRVDVICLATGDTKHLNPAYSGCIRFKLLHPRASQFI